MAEKRKIGRKEKLTITYADYKFLVKLEEDLWRLTDGSGRKLRALWWINEKLLKQVLQKEREQKSEENTKEV